jgi:hypothetical protein
LDFRISVSEDSFEHNPDKPEPNPKSENSKPIPKTYRFESRVNALAREKFADFA